MLKDGVQLCFDRAAIIKIQCRKMIVFNISTAGKQTRDVKGILLFLFHLTVFGGRNHNKLSGQCQFIEKMPRLPSQDILRAFALEIHKNKKSHDISANSCLDCIII